MIVAEFKSPDDFEMVLKDIDEDLCKEKERNSATEVFMDSNSRAKLSDSIPQLTKSHADQDAPRVSPPLQNARTPLSWTRKNRSNFPGGSIQMQKISAQKRIADESKYQPEFPSKRLQGSHVDDQTNSLLVEAGSQPHQQ